MTSTTETAEPNRRELKAAKTRALILEKARPIFLSKGYAEATIRDIATAADRSTGSVFAYWDTKRDLFFDVFGHWPLDGAFAIEAAKVIERVSIDWPYARECAVLWQQMTDRGYFEKDPV